MTLCRTQHLATPEDKIESAKLCQKLLNTESSVSATYPITVDQIHHNFTLQLPIAYEKYM